MSDVTTATVDAPVVKRFVERWLADATLRRDLESAAPDAASRLGLPLDPAELRVLWDEGSRERLRRHFYDGEPLALSPAVSDYLRALKERFDRIDQVRTESVPADRRFATWRARQIARLDTEFEPRRQRATAHPVFACELSDGCSVGCWFCGVDAGRFGGHLAYSDEHAELFRACMAAFGDLCGRRSARHGFLYWASDPFDNPDYERYCAEFRSILGAAPHTTTALAARELERARRFIDEFREPDAPGHIRFSLLTLRQLDAIHAAFSPEDLADVELVPQNKGSLLEISTSGRARGRAPSGREPGSDRPGQTIACVSGFLVNLVRREIRLVTPCGAGSRWPLGYAVLGQATFDGAADFRLALGSLVTEHMHERHPEDRILAFRRDLACDVDGRRIVLTAAYGRVTFERNALLPELAKLVARAELRPAEAAAALHERYGVDRDVVDEWIDLLFRHGLLDEEPRP